MTLHEVYENRRSVNFFDKTKKVDKQTLKSIIDLAVLAPSAFNLQPWRIIAVSTDEAKEKLVKLSNNQPKVLEASVTLIIIGDRGGYKDRNPIWEVVKNTAGEEAMNGAKGMAGFLYGTSEEKQIKFAESNAGLLAMSIMYAAKEYGVDPHPMSGIDFDGIKSEFGLSEDESVVMLVTLGYHDASKALYPRGYRRGFDEIVELL